jgi:hypothetical protein
MAPMMGLAQTCGTDADFQKSMTAMSEAMDM